MVVQHGDTCMYIIAKNYKYTAVALELVEFIVNANGWTAVEKPVM